MSRSLPYLPKTPQLRRCGACQKVGHNRARCPGVLPSSTAPQKKVTSTRQPLPSSTKKSNLAPIHFFVHHVNTPVPESPHIIDLKKDTKTFWQKIQAATPEEEPTSLYHNYHSSFKERPSLTVSSLEDTHLSSEKNLIKIEHVFNTRKTNLLTPFSTKKIAASLKKFSNQFISLFSFPTLKQKLKTAPSSQSKHSPLLRLKHLNFSFENIFKATTPHLTFRRLSPIVALFMILLIIPGPAKSYYYSVKSTKEAVALNSTVGFMALQESTAALFEANLPSAEESTQRALHSFGSAVAAMEEKHRLLQKVISTIPLLSNEVQSRQNLILAGQKITLGNTYLIKGIDESQNIIEDSFTARFNPIMIHLQAAIPNYEQALSHLENVSPDSLPLEYQSAFKDFKLLFTAAVNDFKKISELGQSLQDVFGGKGLRRYLLVFQNPDEIRPTGGFMGSFAELDIKDGKIVKIDIPSGGTYDVQGQLNEHVEPPTPFLIANKRWEFQDANWFPDFPSSAEKILWFYRHTGRGSVDGVIAINSSVLTRLLSLMGPISDEKRNLILTSENILPTIQEIVEEGPEKELHRPKQIIGDLAPKFIEYFKNIKPHQLLPLLSNLKEALDQKEIQAFFSDPQIQLQIKSFGWTGNLIDLKPTQDYLMVVNTNIRGQKSDARINQKISHQTVFQDDGSIVDTVIITRAHSGNKDEKFYGQTNIDYLRVYVPKGSELISASGFKWPDEKSFKVPDSWSKKDPLLSIVEKEISIEPNSGTRIAQEFEKTSFGNWVITEPGETSQVQFSYKLPFKLSDLSQKSPEYLEKILKTSPEIGLFELVVQRQSGSESLFESQVIIPSGWQPVWKDNADMELASNGAIIPEKLLRTDSTWNLAIKKSSP